MVTEPLGLVSHICLEVTHLVMNVKCLLKMLSMLIVLLSSVHNQSAWSMRTRFLKGFYGTVLCMISESVILILSNF